MLRLIIQALFGGQAPPDPLSPPPVMEQAPPDPLSSLPVMEKPSWREAPTDTWAKDIGGGISVTMTIATGHHGFVRVVGESHYQDALRFLVARLGANGVFTARLVPEPDNPYDSNAVAVVVDDHNSATVGYLSRDVARSYRQRLSSSPKTVTCPARLTGAGLSAVGVVLDFEPVREALGLSRVATDQSRMDYDAAAKYHRLNNQNRQFVKETRQLEATNPDEAVARYRRALVALRECRDFARDTGLQNYSFSANQTDMLPLDRVVMCLVRLGKADAAACELDEFVREFPHCADTTLVKAARSRIARALK